MPYRDQKFADRYHKLGDQAEAVFEEVEPLGTSEEFGWRRPKVSMKEMSDEIKHLPDFYTARGYLVEVVGCGKDRTVKFRTSKFRTLDGFWNEAQPLAIFIWNSTSKTWVLIFWPEFKAAYLEAIDTDGVKEFSDGNKYVPLSFDHLLTIGHSGSYDDG